MVKKIIHLIPYDGMGGVEEAARSMGSVHEGEIHFDVRYIFPHITSASERSQTNSVRQILFCGARLAREAPDLVVLSLWRAVAAGLVAKLLRPRLRFVLFVHNSCDAHLFDFLVTRIGLLFCEEVWGDSAASIQKRLTCRHRKPVRVISFLARKLEALPIHAHSPVFAFWGRLSRQKNLPRALRLFALVKDLYPQARFMIVGPDGDDSITVNETIASLKLNEAVEILPAQPFEQILPLLAERGTCFFLQTSKYEGMSMAVTEAMQLGLIPIVTPVGEIANYADTSNAFLLDVDNESSDSLMAQKISALLKSPVEYEKKRKAAIAKWVECASYEQSMREAIVQVL